MADLDAYRADLERWTTKLYEMEPHSAIFRDLYGLYATLDKLPDDEARAWRKEHTARVRLVSRATAEHQTP